MPSMFFIQNPAARVTSRNATSKNLVRQRPPPSLLQGRPRDRTKQLADPNRHTSPHNLLATAPSHGRAPIFKSLPQSPSVFAYIFCFIIFMALLLFPVLYNGCKNYTRRRHYRHRVRARLALSGSKEDANMLYGIDIEMQMQQDDDYSGDDELENTDDEWTTRHRKDCVLAPPSFYGDMEGTIIGNFIK